MSTAALNRRLEALEAVKAPTEGPQVINLVFMRPKGEPHTDDDFRSAIIIGRPDRPGCQVSREDGESFDSFTARVEAERFRVHGPKG